MWPKRKLKLLAVQDAVGLREFQALLKAVGLPYEAEEPGTRIHSGKDSFWNADPRGEVARGKLPDGKVPDGKVPDGKVPDGKVPDGKVPDGKVLDGKVPDGKVLDGKVPDGQVPDREVPGGKVPDGKVPDREVPGGEGPDGKVPDREVPGGEGPGAEMPPGVCTDLIVWPGVSAEAAERVRIPGMRSLSPEEFLAEIWQDEVLLPVFPPLVGIGGKPLQWVVLREAGFAPSLLWQDSDGVWYGEKGPGLGWIVPGVWLREMAGERRLGRERPGEPVSWVVRSDRVDFYAASGVPGKGRYLGALPRWPEPREETEACGSIAQALGLGVAWADVRQALQSLWPGEQLLALKELRPSAAWRTETEGSQPDGVRRLERQSGKELPTEELDDLEDRRAG